MVKLCHWVPLYQARKNRGKFAEKSVRKNQFFRTGNIHVNIYTNTIASELAQQEKLPTSFDIFDMCVIKF